MTGRAQFEQLRISGNVSFDNCQTLAADDVLVRARDYYAGVGGLMVARHHTRKDALAHCLQTATPGTRSHMVGHGNVGAIATGRGGMADRSQPDLFCGARADNVLCLSEIGLWETALINNSVAAELTLVACDVGAGKAGLEFLAELAEAAGHPVGGPTGFVAFRQYGCEEFLFQRGAQFQRVDPDAPLPPVRELPRPATRAATLLLARDGKFVEVSQNRIHTITFYQGAELAFSWSGDTFPLAATSLDQPMPFGQPLALRTGSIEIEYALPGMDGLQSKHLHVYNDRGFFDPDFGGLLYGFDQAILR